MSHLTTLIGRVRNAERNNPGRLDGLLLNLVEYMHYWTDYTPEECDRANFLLEKHNFKTPKDLDDPQVGYSQSCVRCGRALSIEEARNRPTMLGKKEHRG